MIVYFRLISITFSCPETAEPTALPATAYLLYLHEKHYRHRDNSYANYTKAAPDRIFVNILDLCPQYDLTQDREAGYAALCAEQAEAATVLQSQ